MRHYRQTLLIAAALTALGTTALAQPAPPAAGNAPQAQQPMPRHEGKGPQGAKLDPAQRQQRMAERHARHMQELKAKLQITPAQENAWNSFTAAMQPPAAQNRQRMDREAMAKMTTPQRIDAMEQKHAERAAHMRERGAAVKAFYAQLTPAQQGVFDTESLRHMGSKKGPRGKHHHGEHRKGHPAPPASSPAG